MLPRERRLASRREFEAVYAKGSVYTHPLLILKVLKRPGGRPAKFGFATSVKIGKTAVRNRVKRRLRESVRLLLGNLEETGFDAALIARPRARDVAFADIQRAVQQLLVEAGIMKGEEGICSGGLRPAGSEDGKGSGN